MLLDLEYLNKIESFMDSGDLAFEFENGDEDKRLLILEFLEKFMDVAEKADALATKLIFRDGYMELLSGNTDQK
ncbi:hypothetical protein [Desulfovibrio aminophilus]